MIGSTKSDALQIVENMLEDLAKSSAKEYETALPALPALPGRLATDRDPKSIENLLASRGVKVVDFEGWKRIDAFEIELGLAENRARKKVVSKQMLMDIAEVKQ